MQLWALDGLLQLGPITRWLSFEFMEIDLHGGAWEMTLPVGDAGDVATRLAGATWPGIELFDPETGWRGGGVVRAIEHRQQDDGSDSIVFSGVDMQGTLNYWLEWPDSANASNWWNTVGGGTLPLTTDAHNMMYFNVGPGALVERQMPGFLATADPVLGTAKPRTVGRLSLLEVLRGMFLGEQQTARLRLARGITSGIVVQLFQTFGRPISAIVLDADVGTAGSVKLRDSAASATWVVGVGSETSPPARLVVVRSVAATSWRTRRIESAVARPATSSSTELSRDLDNELAAAAASTSVQVTDARVDGYGRRIDLGWNVDVKVRTPTGVEVQRLPVAAARLRWTDGGWVWTVDVGRRAPEGPESILSKVSAVVARIRRLESELMR